MAQLNLVQQGAELAYLLLHDPAFNSRVRRKHLIETGKRIPLKENIELLYRTLREGIPGYEFDFYVLSAAPVEIVQSALEGIVPADHIYGTEFEYGANGAIERLVRCTAGYGKVTRIMQLQAELSIGRDHVVYAGDGSSDMNAMLHVNEGDGLTIAVSESRCVTQIAKRTVLSDNALSVLVPILEEVAHWTPAADSALLRVARLPGAGVGAHAHRCSHPALDGRQFASRSADRHGRGGTVMLSWIGWVATACFGLSYFFKKPATLRLIQAGAATSVDQLRTADPRHAGCCGQRDRSRGGALLDLHERAEKRKRRVENHQPRPDQLGRGTCQLIYPALRFLVSAFPSLRVVPSCYA